MFDAVNKSRDDKTIAVPGVDNDEFRKVFPGSGEKARVTNRRKAVLWWKTIDDYQAWLNQAF